MIAIKDNDEPPETLDLAQYAFFLDFDGTLAPIVKAPEDACMAPATAGAVSSLSSKTGGAVAALSGRALADLEQRLAPIQLPAAGSHGFEISGVGLSAATDDFMPAHDLEAAAKTLADFAATRGLLFEEKPGAITIHYRSAPETSDVCQTLVDELARSSQTLRSMHGHMVSELTLTGVDKGTALDQFMQVAPFRGRMPIMAGDDVTDEFGFRAAEKHGGFGVKVGIGATNARYRSENIEVFLDWLVRIAEN